MNQQNDSMKWVTDPREEAPADRQVGLAIFGVLGSFVVLWGALGYMSGEQVHRNQPIARNDVETVQLLPRGGSLDDPQPIPVPDLSPVNLPEGVVSDDGAGTTTIEASLANEAVVVAKDPSVGSSQNSEGGLWSWVSSIFNGDAEEPVVRTQPLASRQAGEAPPAAVPAPAPDPAQPQAEAVPAPEQPAPANPAPAPAQPIVPAPIAPVPAPGTNNSTNNTIADPTLIAGLFNTLRIAPEVDAIGFTKDIFGEGWSDTDENNCSTRNDIFGRDLADAVRGEDGCQVVSGTLTDPYTGTVFTYEADPQTDDDVQVDHVVSLRNAWVTGGQELPTDLKTTFKNDPLNLVTVLGTSKDMKGDQNAAQWLPATPFACEYIGRQIAVKARYGLWVTPEEHAALKNGLAACTPMRVDGDAIVFIEEDTK